MKTFVSLLENGGNRRVFFHGTATGKNNEILDSILEYGLKAEPPARVYSEIDDPYYPISDAVYMTPRLSVAKTHAAESVARNGGKRVIVRVLSDWDIMYPDEDWFISSVLNRIEESPYIYEEMSDSNLDRIEEVALGELERASKELGWVYSSDTSSHAKSVASAVSENIWKYGRYDREGIMTDSDFRNSMYSFIKSLKPGDIDRKYAMFHEGDIGYSGFPRILDVEVLD